MYVDKVDKLTVYVAPGVGFADAFQVINRETQQAVDVSNLTIQAHLRADLGASGILANFAVAVTDAVNGWLSLSLDAATAAALTPRDDAVISFSYRDTSGLDVPLPLAYAHCDVVRWSGWQ